jgi:uncharacterized alpha-E superfamily protein
MLSRVANSLFWIGRYIERAEHLARFTRVQYLSALDAPLVPKKQFILESILDMVGSRFEHSQKDLIFQKMKCFILYVWIQKILIL